MNNRWRRRAGAVLGTLTLTTGLFVATGPAAEATPNGLFDCQQVAYFDLLAGTPIFGSGCTGPVGDQPAGSIYDIPRHKWYSCQHEKGTVFPDGVLTVNGQGCIPF